MNTDLKVSQSLPLEVVPPEKKLVEEPQNVKQRIMSYIMSFDERDKKDVTDSQKSSSDQEKVYEKTKEYFLKQELLELSRLRKARFWVLIVLSYWILRFFLI
jgi:hypothetical protein